MSELWFPNALIYLMNLEADGYGSRSAQRIINEVIHSLISTTEHVWRCIFRIKRVV